MTPTHRSTLFDQRFAPKHSRPRRAKAKYVMPRCEGNHLIFIDPSACSLGYAVFVSGQRHTSGTWSPTTRIGAKDRYDQLGDFLKRLLVPAALYDVVVETPSGGGYRMQFTTGVVYGRAIGVVEGVCNVLGARVHRITVNDWKGRQKKGSTLLVVRHELKYEPCTDDESDALGLGLWWLAGQKRLREIEARSSRGDRG